MFCCFVLHSSVSVLVGLSSRAWNLVCNSPIVKEILLPDFSYIYMGLKITNKIKDYF